jgi:hypothetical protein
MKIWLQVTYSKVWIGKHLSDTFLIQKQRDPYYQYYSNFLSEALSVSNKENCLEGNAQEHNTQQNYNMKVPDKSTENVENFRHLGTTVTNQSHIHEKIKEQIKFEKCLIPFGKDPCVSPLSKKYKC